MKLLKNPELKYTLALLLVLTAALAAVGFGVCTEAGLLVLAAGALFTAVLLTSAYLRYRAISNLSFSIDRILHGQEPLLLSDSSEGELAILTSEVQKMTVRLREQSEVLKSDKIRLTDAIADISHQLRTPLTSVNLTLALLNSGDISEEKRIQLIRDLTRSLSRIDWLVEALLKISKLDAGASEMKSERIYVRQLTDLAMRSFAVPLELRGQEIRINVGDESFIGDLQWTAEALENIIKNCIEHTPSGGYIEINASETAIFTEITIHDSGNGFEESDIPHLFERFYRGKNASESSVGIGLALARAVISLQNGTVKASNHPAGGAVFTVRFYKSVL